MDKTIIDNKTTIRKLPGKKIKIVIGKKEVTQKQDDVNTELKLVEPKVQGKTVIIKRSKPPAK